MPPRYLERPRANLDGVDLSVELPYGMTAEGVVAAINELYAYLHVVNSASVHYGYGRLEDFMQPAGFSGLLSNVFVRAVTKSAETATPGLALNRYPNGRPDIVPRTEYPGDAVRRGQEGIEVKASRARSGWQGHNAETGWILIVQLEIDTNTEPVHDRTPTCIERVLIANLDSEDWSFSGRGPGSRRTPTASINQRGRKKLEAGVVYCARR